MRVVQIIYVETLCNPSSDVPDLAAIVDFARANNLVSFIDNTFASPVVCRSGSFSHAPSARLLLSASASMQRD